MTDAADRAALTQPEDDLRQGCVCPCCSHSEGSDCACDCHASGACSAALAVRLRAVQDRILSLATFSQKVYASMQDGVGRTIVTVDVESVLAILHESRSPDGDGQAGMTSKSAERNADVSAPQSLSAAGDHEAPAIAGSIPADSHQSAEARLRAVEAHQDAWQPIETAPKDGDSPIIVYDANYKAPVIPAEWDRDDASDGGQCWRAADAVWDRLNPTLWQPLPVLPAVVGPPAPSQLQDTKDDKNFTRVVVAGPADREELPRRPTDVISTD